MENVKTINYFINYECDEWLLVNKNIILMVNPNKNQLKFVISAIYKIFYKIDCISNITHKLKEILQHVLAFTKPAHSFLPKSK